MGQPVLPSLCVVCQRRYGHLDGCKVKSLHEELNLVIANVVNFANVEHLQFLSVSLVRRPEEWYVAYERKI